MGLLSTHEDIIDTRFSDEYLGTLERIRLGSLPGAAVSLSVRGFARIAAPNGTRERPQADGDQILLLTDRGALRALPDGSLQAEPKMCDLLRGAGIAVGGPGAPGGWATVPAATAGCEPTSPRCAVAVGEFRNVPAPPCKYAAAGGGGAAACRLACAEAGLAGEVCREGAEPCGSCGRLAPGCAPRGRLCCCRAGGAGGSGGALLRGEEGR